MDEVQSPFLEGDYPLSGGRGVQEIGPAPKSRPTRVEGWFRVRVPIVWFVVLAVTSVIVIGLLVALAFRERGPSDIRAGVSFTGTVSIVNEGGTKFCLTGDLDGKQYCSLAFLEPDAEPLKVGQHVEITTAIITMKDRIQEVYLVTEPDPSQDKRDSASSF